MSFLLLFFLLSYSYIFWNFKTILWNCVFYLLISSFMSMSIFFSQLVLPKQLWKHWFRGGGFSHWHGIRICTCLLGRFFAKFGMAIGDVSSETKEPKLHKLGVFWANYCKKHPIWSNCVPFFRKCYTDGWEIRPKIGIEIVRFSRSGRHIHVRFWWKKPSGHWFALFYYNLLIYFIIQLYNCKSKNSLDEL